MNYPYKYCLIVEYNAAYSGGSSQFLYCDFAEAKGDYDSYVDDGHKCALYRILEFDNFDL